MPSATGSAAPTGSVAPTGSASDGSAAPTGSVASASDGSIPAPVDPDVVAGLSVNRSCTFVGITPHVAGRLEGNPSDPTWPVWIMSLTGRQMFVLWPAGFRVRFVPRIALIDETGRVVSSGSVELDQVSVDEHQGTMADPYVASGLMFGRCYVHRDAAASP